MRLHSRRRRSPHLDVPPGTCEVTIGAPPHVGPPRPGVRWS
ncbi:hypothetical protein YT1_p10111 (plasmid) [Rhodococcus ruber]|nr:hypothetical protein YT1_p10111 [Rhodococcus ruber]